MLKTALKKEVDKVKQLRPKQYFICCGRELTEGNIKEVYEMFSEFMTTDRNIVTLTEIDEFLQNSDNEDIVRKNYKLWLYSSNILSEVYNKNIFIDCETLLSDINEECKYFVSTHIYEVCMNHLLDHGTLMLTGGPGVGKTITSKMLILYFATKGYKIRYTTNGDISDIKKSLSHDKEQKEIVLLDDCLGQHYFKMKESQEDELLSLIKYTKLFTNKKIILNSRITIFNEAKERSYDFKNFFQQKKVVNYIINMDEITQLEKAKILYNHIKTKKLPENHYSSIKENKNYLKIVRHQNYTPRIIEYVTFEHNYSRVAPKSFFNFILNNLTNPHDIWRNEFEQRIQSIDRVFLTTLYSLTDTYIEHDILKKCFLKRATTMNIDSTIDHWSLVLSRLNQSIINIVDLKDKQNIGVINPSVNDYLKIVFNNNYLELNAVRDSICNALQFERCYPKSELPQIYKELITNESVNNIDFSDSYQKNHFITSQIIQYSVKNTNYNNVIFDYLSHSYCHYNYPQLKYLSNCDILSSLLSDEFYNYYSMDNFIHSKDNISNLLEAVEIDDLIITINILDDKFREIGVFPSWFGYVCKVNIYDAVNHYFETIDTSDYCDNYNMGDLIDNYTNSYDAYVDKSSIVSALEKRIMSDVKEEVQEKLSTLENGFDQLLQLPTSIYINTVEIEIAVDSFLREPYQENYINNRSNQSFTSEIEAIFER